MRLQTATIGVEAAHSSENQWAVLAAGMSRADTDTDSGPKVAHQNPSVEELLVRELAPLVAALESSFSSLHIG